MTQKWPMFRDPALQKSFDEQGYVVVRILTPDQAAGFAAQIESLIPAQPVSNDPQGHMYNSTFDPDSPQPVPKDLAAIIAERLAELLEGYRNLGACVLGKPAKAGRLDLHSHQPLTPNIFAKDINCWLTLEDVAADHCALTVVPRSQRILRHIQSFSSPPYFADFQNELETDFATTVPMRAGEAMLMDGSLLHGSHPNRTDRTALRVFSVLVEEGEPYCIISESEGPVFDAYAVEGKVFDPELHCMCEGSLDGLEHKGRLDSRNTQITKAEFERLLQMDERIAPGFDPIDAVRAATGAVRPEPFWRRLGRMLKSREDA